jgi:hypothetical protein
VLGVLEWLAMGFIRPVVLLALLAVGCGGESSRSRSDGTSGAGSGTGGSHAGTSDCGVISGIPPESTTGGNGTGGAAEVAQPAGLGDGDRAIDGQPTVPAGITGGFFWRGCGNTSWRIGNWWVTSDRQRDALIREIDPPRDGSTQARGAQGADYPAGAALWVELDHPRGAPVKLAGCSAISFWARLDAPSGQITVALNDGSHPSGSLEGRSTLPSTTLDVGPGWQEFVLPFESFPLPGGAADGISLASIEFFVGDGGEEFDLWVDDLALVNPSN